MDWLIDLGITALLRAIKNVKKQQQFYPAFAKVQIALENAEASHAPYAEVVQDKRLKAGFK